MAPDAWSVLLPEGLWAPDTLYQIPFPVKELEGIPMLGNESPNRRAGPLEGHTLSMSAQPLAAV